MKRDKSLLAWAFILSIFVFTLVLLDALAMSDIYKDYVSVAVLNSVGANISNLLPEWSAAKLEWGMISISFIMKTILLLLIIVLLGRAGLKAKKEVPAN